MARVSICDGWEFGEMWNQEFSRGEGPGAPVRLPHTTKEVSLHHADESAYQMVCGYRRRFPNPGLAPGDRLLVRFDGAAHEATVFLNGEQVGFHAGGYTAFAVDLTDHLGSGENCLAVRLDSRESLNQPPFGHVVDYLTFGGLYREVWWEVRGPSRLEDLFVQTPTNSAVIVQGRLEGPAEGLTLRLEIRSSTGAVIGSTSSAVAPMAQGVLSREVPVSGAEVWDLEHPALSILEASLLRGDMVVDVQTVRFGFRQVEFRPDGVFLNGRRVKLRGLNRHQAWPYVGYAAPAGLQRHDAEVLKRELRVNAVRTSHYPQSQHFLDRCDELGLLVFTEIPGWQHIGDDAWQNVALASVQEMILQYRNHPSIILWGVRINESQDSDALYRRTNQLARKLDPSRPTSGVRFLWKSQLHEDVYAFNDFSHAGFNRGLLPRWFVSPDPKKAYLISEFNGHMFPTKTFDDATHRLEHALRHATVLDAVYKNPRVVGGFGWCMTDYYTHGDFGSGDRVCYHGVMDQFRNPKLAAALYASADGGGDPVLAVGSDMHIGDYPAGSLGVNVVFTNADAVRYYKGDRLIREFPVRSRRWKALAHPPVEINDTIGDALARGEGWKEKKAEAFKRSLFDVQVYGLKMPVGRIIKTLGRMLRWGVGPARLVKLYLKYAENWGTRSPVTRFEAVKEGRVVATVLKAPSSELHLEAATSHTALVDADTYDLALVRLRVVDQWGNTAPYAQLPLELSVEGPADLVGPKLITAEGGMTGTLVRTRGRSGTVSLTIRSPQTPDYIVKFTVERRQSHGL